MNEIVKRSPGQVRRACAALDNPPPSALACVQSHVTARRIPPDPIGFQKNKWPGGVLPSSDFQDGIHRFFLLSVPVFPRYGRSPNPTRRRRTRCEVLAVQHCVHCAIGVLTSPLYRTFRTMNSVLNSVQRS